MITINNSLFSKYTYSKIHCLYASKKEYMLKDICTESINIIYVQLYANYYVKQILSNIISIISFHIAPAPNNDSPPCKTSCCSSNHSQESLKKERKKERAHQTGWASYSPRRFHLHSVLKEAVWSMCKTRGSVIILPLMG